MKKHIIIFATIAMAALFVSCKNKDIQISRTVNFKVNPYEVISGFDYEVNAGELESFDSDYKLRVHLLVYDNLGYLVATDVQYLTNYQSIMNSSLELADGEYTAVAITDVVEYNGSVTFNFWTITGTERLSDLKVADAGYIGGKYKILGATNYHFDVREGSIDHTIRVQPAGALILVAALNIHYYNTVVMYELDMNKTSDFCTFNSDGSYEVAIENNGGDFDWRLCYFEPNSLTGDVCYGYYFVLPLGHTSFQWYCKTNDGTWYYAGDEMSANIKFGEEYLAYMELGSDIDVEMLLVNGSKAVELPMGVKMPVQNWCDRHNKTTQVENPKTLK